MAGMNVELPTDVLKDLERVEVNTSEMMGEMVQAGADVVLAAVRSALSGSFASTRSLIQGLRVTRVYRTPSDGGINVKVGFFGYSKLHRSKKYPNGVPIELIANAREYGTSSGETAKPFFRKQFRRKAPIESAMQRVQDKYLPKD